MAITRNAAPDPAMLMALRHLREFGFTGWHLRQGRSTRPSAGGEADNGGRFERRLAQADHYAAEDFDMRDGGAVFLMMGRPRPEAGDGLVALTRHWTVEATDVVHQNGAETVYAVLCT